MRHSILFALFLALLSSCAPQGEPTQNTTEPEKISIVCTTGMLADLAKDVAGDFAEVTSLMGPGVDPHLYKASQGDLKQLQSADLIIYNGLHLEAKLGTILEKMAERPDKKVVAAAEAIDASQLIESDEEGEAYDPHVWMDVALWKETIDPMAQAIIELMPSKKGAIEANANYKRSLLEELDRKVRNELNTIPDEKRIMITAHDAFSYFGRAYAVEVMGLQGVSTLSEAGLKDVTRMVDLIIERDIRAIFVETIVSDRSMQSVIAGCKEKGHEVSLESALFSDAMGAENTPEGTYEGMVLHNVNLLVQALK